MSKYKKAWQHYKELGSPKYFAAPMVHESYLVFRLLWRKYGAQIAYSPMYNCNSIHSKSFFQTNKKDSPFVIQFCGNDANKLLKACKMVENDVDAVDINCGCPQRVAKSGKYGAFLLDEEGWGTIETILKTLTSQVKVPIWVKIRILEDDEKTMELVRNLQDWGCQLLTVHGRTRFQVRDNKGLANWDIIKRIKEELDIPVISNGNIRTFADIEKCLEYTKCDGVMAAEGLLKNPALFMGKNSDNINMYNIAREYIELGREYKQPHNDIRRGIANMMGKENINKNHELRDKFWKMNGYDEFLLLIDEMEKIGFYEKEEY